MIRIGRICGLMVLLAMTALAAEAKSERIPLIKFAPSPQLELRCVNGSGSVSLPIPERWDVKRVVLGLRYTLSNNLIMDTSQMTIRVNDQPIAQTKLNPLAPNVELELEVPVRLLKSGYNTLQFQVAQHYSRNASGCENLCAPDLWTHINLLDSYLEIDYDWKPLPLNMGLVASWLFDPKTFPDAQINIITERFDAKQATLASVVTSGIARRFDYRKVSFKLSKEALPGMDNVVVGTPEFVNRVVGKTGAKLGPVSGGVLRMYHAPDEKGGSDPRFALLAVTGESDVAIRIAATTLANLTLPYPGGQELKATGFKLPDLPMYGGRQVLSTDKSYDFKTLNFQSFSWVGFNSTPLGLSFRLPADFLIKQNQYAKLALNFSYSAGLRGDSVFNVLVNGKPLRSIYLDQVSGSYIENYKMDIPTYVFKPGANTITFSPVLNVPRQVCDSGQVDGTFLTVFDNSTLIFPPMPHMVELPKLDLFALNGFPFTRWPDGFETLIYVPAAEPAGLEAALNLVGVITQKNGFPLFGTEIVTEEPKGWKGELLIIGRIGAIPATLLAGAPLKSGREGTIPYPVVRGWEVDASVAYSTQSSALGEGRGVIMQYESPFQRGRSVLLLTAETAADLGRLGEALLDPGVQGVAAGDLMLIEYGEPERHKVTVMSAGPKYVTGNKGDVSWLDSYLYSNRIVYYIGLAVSLIGLAILGWALMRRRRARRERPAAKIE